MTPCSPSTPRDCCAGCSRRHEITPFENARRSSIWIDASALPWPFGICPMKSLDYLTTGGRSTAHQEITT